MYIVHRTDAHIVDETEHFLLFFASHFFYCTRTDQFMIFFKSERTVSLIAVNLTKPFWTYSTIYQSKNAFFFDNYKLIK